MKMPDTSHWAIITTTNTYIPGDERSRTNPGHGYPEHYVESINYESFTDYDKFLARVTQMSTRKETFKAILANPIEVKTTVTVSVKQ